MKKLLFSHVLLLLAAFTVSCRKTIDDYPLANLRAISSFDIEYYHNSGSNIFIHHYGVIDETNRYITVSVPTDADLSHLRPSIKLSPWTTCHPGNLDEVDFSNGEVEYEVTAQSGKKAYYRVLITADYVYQDANLLRLFLSDIPLANAEDIDPDDPTSGRSATPDSYMDGALVQLLLENGSGYDLTRQRTHLDVSASSHKCSIEVAEFNDESNYRPFHDLDTINYSDTVIYRITAESGKVIRYRAVVREKTE
ncbi:MAG: hypothetical protein IJS13_06630 [Paludibacteraceae bacterium]|nr:hypothetical protein [Paludibacteraceae bacterium]